jgi:urease accessory protein
MLGRVNAPVTREVRGWLGQLELEIERAGERSLLARRRHLGPLYVQRPFYPEGPQLVHCYLLHPPGGVVGGDRLDISVSIAAGASALLTTPAAQKLYRSAGAESALDTHLTLAAGATLEWLPSETIVFDGARARQRTRIELAPDAGLLGWEVSCLGRPANGIRFDNGRVVLGLEIQRSGTPLLIERLTIDGGSPVLDEAWGFGGMPIAGTLYAVPPRAEAIPELVERLRRIEPHSGLRYAVTSLGQALVLRALGEKLEGVRRLFITSWELLRPEVIGRAPARPRIWAT